MRYYFIIIIYILFCSNSLLAQEAILKGYIPIDSLKNRDPKVYIDHFKRTAPVFKMEPDSLFANEVAMTYLWTAFQKKDTLNMWKAYVMLGQLGNHQLGYYDKAIEYIKNYNYKFQSTLTSIKKSDQLSVDGNYKNAYLTLVEALKASKKNNYLEYIIKTKINELRSNWGDKTLAIKGYLENLELINSNDFYSIFPQSSKEYRSKKYVDTQYDLAQAYYNLKEINQASIYIDSVYQYGVKNNLEEYKLNYYGFKGGILYREGKYQEALEHINYYLEENESDDLYSFFFMIELP